MNNKMLSLGLDVAVAVALITGLIAAIGTDALLTHFFPADANATTNPDDSSTTITKKTVTKGTRLAVTEPYVSNLVVNGTPERVTWDDVGKLLDSMGEGYRYEWIKEKTLTDLDKLKQYDVVFCSCSGVEPDRAVASVLRAYVMQGGTLYASDWRYNLVAEAFPDVRAADVEGSGKDVLVRADVVDPGLRDILGPKVELKFELDTWKPAAFKGDRVKVLLRGKYTDIFNGSTHIAPLLVKFTYGKGNVIFTSYHHGKENNETEKKLLKYLVYSLVTAKVETEILEQISSQFSPAKSNLFSASKENPKVTYTYQHSQAGKLRFDLGFTGEGAELKLAIKSPSGKKFEKQSTSKLTIEVPDAETGEWTYTVTAVRVPHENFAFFVNVAHGKK